MLEEEHKQDFLNGSYIMRRYGYGGEFEEYRVLNDSDSKYRLSRWKNTHSAPTILAEGLTGDEVWNFMKLMED